jgi:SNF2 family DNA or RNA helicase
MIIVDEMQNFRNKDGVRVKEMLELKNKIYCRDNLLMSGTPIKARPNEIVPAMLMIDPLFTDHAAEIYDKCFALDSVMAMSIIQQRFGKIIYRKTKAILDLPEKHNERLPLKISKPEKYYMVNIKREVMKVFDKLYADALKQNVSLRNEFISIVDRYSTSNLVEKNKYLNWIIKTVNTDRSMAMHELDQEFIETYIDKFLKPNIPSNSGTLERLKWLEVNFLRMERSCMGKAIGQIYPKYRTEMFIAIYEENKQKFYDMITQHPKKTIIFSQMLGVVNYIHNDLNKNGIGAVKVVGGMSDTPAVIDKFKGDNNTLVLVATSQTLNSAVTLNEASQMFFFGPPFRSTDMQQCEDRIHRIGQTSEVYIYNVVLDTASYNLSNRMETIVNWSNQMFSTAMQLDEIPALESVMLSCAPIEEYEGYILQYLICPELFEDKGKKK